MAKMNSNPYQLMGDLSAGLVVFLVALPLCLGIALASGAPLSSGLIAGITGGIVIGALSGSVLSISGPAAGLSVIVSSGIDSLGGFAVFSLAVMMAGCMQLLLGFVRAGVIAAFFPNAVIRGMLAAIGIILIIKQIPHATGFDLSFDGDESYMQETVGSSLVEILEALGGISPGVLIVSLGSVLLLILGEKFRSRATQWSALIPPPLLVVIWGLVYQYLSSRYGPEWQISRQHLVNLPELGSFTAFVHQLALPDFTQLTNPLLIQTALSLALIASLETLMSIEAIDKLDPLKRTSPPNRELKAQGLGNLINGLVGGLPVTALIVRSSANINAGGQTRLSSLFHGILLLASTVYFSSALNQIPLACLASILLMTGFKLAKPAIFREIYQQGWSQFAPFLVTVLAILVTDLLQGIAVGMLTGFFFVLKANYHASISLTELDQLYLIRMHKDVSFLNKALLRGYLQKIPPHSDLLIDGQRAHFIDHDILETLRDFSLTAEERHIRIEIKGFRL